MTTYTPTPTASIESLEERYAPYLQSVNDLWFTVCHEPPTGGWKNQTFKLSDLESAAEWIQSQGSVNIYTSMAVFQEPPRGKGKKAEVYGSHWLWVDLDIYRPMVGEDLKGSVVTDLERFDPPPTHIVSSGGGLYGLWRLSSLETDSVQIEARNRWLAKYFEAYGSDSCWNVDRVLRLPGTFNARRQDYCRYLRSHDQNVYALERFDSHTTVEDRLVTDIEVEVLPANFVDQVRSNTPKLWMRIATEDTAKTAGAPLKDSEHVDRHLNDMAIVYGLLTSPHFCTPGQVAAVLTRPEWFASEKYRENGWAYVEATISHALRTYQPERLDFTYSAREGGKPVFSAHKAQRIIRERWNIRSYARQLYLYTDVTGQWREMSPQFVPEVLAQSVWDGYRSSDALETRLQLEQFATIVPAIQPYWLNTLDGLYDLRSGEVIPHTPSIFTLDQVPLSVKYEPTPKDFERLDAFVNPKLGTDELISLWWMFVGHTLWSGSICPGIWFLWGAPRAGKSALFDLLEGFLGPENVSHVDVVDLADNEYYVSQLVGKRANVCHDTSGEIPIKRVSLLKSISGGEPRTIRRIYGEPFDHSITAKLFFASNQPVQVNHADEGWFRRVFSVQCHDVWNPDREGYTPHIGKKLIAADGVKAAMLHRALEGLRQLQAMGEYPAPSQIIAERDGLRADQDTVYSFWMDRTVEGERFDYIVFDTLYTRYMAYCELSGRYFVSKNRFGRRTSELCVSSVLSPIGKEAKSVDGKTRIVYTGRKLKEGD